MVTKTTHKQLGLVLGGGGARGFAHIGVIKVMEESGITISRLAGCSMGGLIASLFASGYSVEELENIARRFSSKRELIKLVDRTPSRRGLLGGNQIRKFLSRFISPDARIEETRIPLMMNAVDLISGREITLAEGNLLDSIMATTAVPGIFPPVEVGSYRLVDGGVLNDVPVKLLKNSPVELILAVDVHLQNEALDKQRNDIPIEYIPLRLPVIMQNFYRVETIMTNTLIERNLLDFPPDLLVSPVIPGNITALFGFHHAVEIINAGEKAMREKLPELLELLNGHV